jgi:hypothetical protein
MKTEGSAFSQAWPGSPCIPLRHDGDKEREKEKGKRRSKDPFRPPSLIYSKL